MVMENYPSQTPEKSPESYVDDDDDELAENGGSDARQEIKPDERDKKDAKPEKPQTQEPHKPEKPINEDGEIPLESLADDELKMVAQDYINSRTEALKTELTSAESESTEEAAALANAALLEALEDKLSSAAMAIEGAVDAAVYETSQELGLENSEHQPVSETADSNQSFAMVTEATADNSADDQEDDANTAAASPAGSGSGQSYQTPSPIPLPNSSSTGGGNSLPPFSPGSGVYGGPPYIPNYNVAAGAAPNTSAPPAQAPEARPIIKHNAAAPYLLLGYLIGRRRGRINTENKLFPVQKKLEKEVTDLRKIIAAGEERIRNMAIEASTAKPAAAVAIAERLERLGKSKREATGSPVPDKSPGLHAERLGKLMVEDERSEKSAQKPSKSPEKVKTAEPLRVPERPKDTEQMKVNELLLIAAQISAEHGNIKKLYENGKLSESDLRQITKAYLRGERYGHILNKTVNNEAQPDVSTPESDAPGAASQPQSSSGGPLTALRNHTRKGHTASNNGNGAVNRSINDGSNIPSTTSGRAGKQSALAAVVVIAVIVLLVLLLRR